MAGAIEHQDYPFELLMQRLGLGRQVGFNPNPEVMFALQLPHRFAEERRAVERLAVGGAFAPGRTGLRFDLGGLVVEKYNPTPVVTLNDLALEMIEMGGELSAALHFRTDLFRPDTVARIREGLCQLLAQLPEATERPVALLDLPRRLPEAAAATPAGQADGRRADGRDRDTAAAGPADPTGGAPRTPEEAELTRLFVEVLGTDQVGRDDSFFARGGHSLLALQLLARIRDTFQVELPLRQLFEVSTVAGLAAVLSRRDSASPDRPILLRTDTGPAPLSFAQERLWFQDQLERAPYLIPIAARIEGDLDERALEAALEHVVRRHEVLRSTVEARGGSPVQVVQPPAPVRIPLTDLTGAAPAARDGEIDRFIRREIRQPFDLARGPLWQVALLRLDRRSRVIVLVMHHVVGDGWSIGVLLRELSDTYAALASGAEAALPALHVQYSDYARWQRDVLAAGPLTREVDYWRRQLAGVEPLRLPLDKPRPAVQSFRGSMECFEIGAGLTSAVRRVSEAEGVTLFMTLLAAFQLLLYRYSGQDDVAVVTPVAGRDRIETEGLIGCFLNLLVMRGSFSANPTFAEHLRRTRERCLDAWAHQSVPFERLVEMLGPPRDLSRQPLAQVMFVLQNAPLPPLRLGDDARLIPIPVDRGSTAYDLTLSVTESGPTLSCVMEYARDLFDPATIRRMIGHFESIVGAAATNPHLRVAYQEMLTSAEREFLATGCNRTGAPLSAACWRELFEQQAARAPEAIAVLCGPDRITYGALNAWANRLASDLIERGTGPERIVAVAVGRSPALAASLLAVAKSGAAWAYLDPALPDVRRRFILEETRARILIHDGGRPADAEHALDVVETGRHEDGDRGNPAPNPPPASGPDNLAYVILTSGSTGVPKGVMVTERGLSNYLEWCTGAYGMRAGDRAFCYTSPAYDFSLTSLLGPLVSGGTVVMAESAGADGASASTLADPPGDLALLKVTPGGARLATAAHRATPNRPVAPARTIIVGGEALVADDVADWLHWEPPPVVFNEYGPTETVVGCAVHRVEPGSPPGPVPIGRPVANTYLYVVDRYLELVPVGVAGELCVGGAGVARGYLNRPDLTAERFVPDPFSGAPGARMYCTGDLARRRTDGVLEYLGRTDDQVKIRGHLVEPAEVEAALLGHPEIASCAVVAETAPGGDRRLRAFVVPRGRRAAKPETVTQYLRSRIPQFMVPASVTTVKALPLAPTGKVDRLALASRVLIRAPSRGRHGALMTSDEQRVAAIWSELLGSEIPGADAEFFECGGHSLLVVRLAAKLGEAFGVELPIVALFEATTVGAQATLMRRLGEPGEGAHLRPVADSAPARAPGPALVSLRTSRPASPVVCLHPAGGGVAVYGPLARTLRPARPVFGLESRAVAGDAAEHETLDAMADDYAAAICRRWPTGRLRLVGWSTAGLVAWHVAAAIERAGRNVALVVLLDTRLPGEAAPAATPAGLGAHLERVARLLSPPGCGRGEKAAQIARTRLSLLDHHERLARSCGLPPLTAKVVRLVAGGSADGGAQPAPLLVSTTSAPVAVEQFVVEGDHYSMLVEPAVSGAAGQLAEAIWRGRAKGKAGRRDDDR